MGKSGYIVWLTLCALCTAMEASLPATAQTAGRLAFTLSGTVSDAATGKPLHGANISEGKEKRQAVITDEEGRYSIELPTGANTELTVTHVGYVTARRHINGHLPAGRHKAKRLDIALTPHSSLLQETTVTGHKITGIIRGDTTSYRLPKTNRDATLGEALGKLPGFRYENGQLEINGEKVTRLMIEDTDFFKGDIGMALKNLQADIVSRVDVFDKRSDYAELTGIDDGRSQRTVNIRTKKGVEESVFGKLGAGCGTDERYKLYGMLNAFSRRRRLSVFTQWNNVNEQNFSLTDMLSSTAAASGSAPAQSPYSKGSTNNAFHPAAPDDVASMTVDADKDGITSTKALGVNYTDNLNGGHTKFSGHYLLNATSNSTDYGILNEYFEQVSPPLMQRQHVVTDNINHRLSTKIESSVGRGGHITIVPAVAWQRKEEQSALTAGHTDAMEEEQLRQSRQLKQSAVWGTNELIYLHKLGDKGHSIGLHGNFSYSRTAEDISLTTEEKSLYGHSASQNIEGANNTTSVNIATSYVHPTGSGSGVKMEVGWQKQYSRIERDTKTSGITPASASDFMLCGETTSEYGGIVGNAAYMNSADGRNIVIGTECDVLRQKVSNRGADRHTRHYTTLLPFLIFRKNGRGCQLHLQYRTHMGFPSIIQMEEAVNSSNPVMTIKGNSELEPSYNHSLLIRIVIPNIIKRGTIGVLFANLEQADNFIATQRALGQPAVSGNDRLYESITYRNTDGYFSANGLMAFGFPAKFVSANMNVSTALKYIKLPGYWNDMKDYTHSWYWDSSVTIGSDISEKTDFTIDVNCKYNKSMNKKHNAYDVSYWTLSLGGQFNWQISSHVKILIECGRTCYYGTSTSQFNAFICNSAVAYRFLKGQRGELRLQCNDIFNNNNSFNESVNEMYRQQITANTLKRYFILSFTYNVNKILNKHGKTN